MSRSRLRFLRRVKKVIEEYEKHKGGHTTVAGIWRTFIDEKFDISLAQFRQYLSINYKKELKKYEEKP